MVILPAFERYFWDCDVNALDWETQRDFISRRLLKHGDQTTLRWLRAQWGDMGLKNWLIAQQGAGLTPRQVRYWSVILDIDPVLADEWVAAASDSVWERRRA